MVAPPGSRTRSPLILEILVIAALAFLAAVAGLAPFVVPPPGVSTGVGLAGFQIMLAAAAGFLALILLLAASATGIFWPQFLYPADDGRDALRSLQWAGWALGAVVASSSPSWPSASSGSPRTRPPLPVGRQYRTGCAD